MAFINEYIHEVATSFGDKLDEKELTAIWKQITVTKSSLRKNAHVHIIDLLTVTESAMCDYQDYKNHDEKGDPFDLDRLNKYATSEWKNGDVLKIKDFYGYRNQATYMWDGQKVCKLYTTVDDYGSVPSNFLVGKGGFHARYWSGKDKSDKNAKEYEEQPIDHNGMVFAEFDTKTCKKLNDAYDKLKEGEYTFEKFQYGGHEWTMMLYEKVDDEGKSVTGIPFDNKKNKGMFTNVDDNPALDVFFEMLYGGYNKDEPYDSKKEAAKCKEAMKKFDELVKDKDYFLCNSINPEWLKRSVMKDFVVNESVSESKIAKTIEKVEKYLKGQKVTADFGAIDDTYTKVPTVRLWIVEYDQDESNKKLVAKVIEHVTKLMSPLVV